MPGQNFNEFPIAPWVFSPKQKSFTRKRKNKKTFSILKELRSIFNVFKQPWMHEIIGFFFLAAVLICVSYWTAAYWTDAYLSPVNSAVSSDCLVLDSQQVASIDSFGLDREPLLRAEVSVYVFAFSIPTSCQSRPANSSSGVCDLGFVATAYDDARGLFTAGDKSEFLRTHGQPGSFYPCWHSLDRSMVLLDRDPRTAMILLPLFAAFAAFTALARVALLLVFAARTACHAGSSDPTECSEQEAIPLRMHAPSCEANGVEEVEDEDENDDDDDDDRHSAVGWFVRDSDA